MRSGDDPLAVHLHWKSSTKYRNVASDNSLGERTGRREAKGERRELRGEVLLKDHPFKRKSTDVYKSRRAARSRCGVPTLLGAETQR